jgi:hypothetical protein
MATFGIVKVMECSNIGRMESVGAASWEHGWAYCLIINSQDVVKRERGIKGTRGTIRPTCTRRIRPLDWGQGQLNRLLSQREKTTNHFFMSIHLSALPRV